MTKSRVEILNDLGNIRFYYSHKSNLDSCDLLSSFLPIVSLYDNLMRECQNLKLIDLYKSLYHDNNSLTSLSILWDYSTKHLSRLHNALINYIEKKLHEED